MSFRMQVTDTDTIEAVRHLEGFEVVADKYHRVALRKTMNQLASQIEPSIPSRTGQAREDFHVKVGSEGMSNAGDKAFAAGIGGEASAYGTKFLVGRVGWFGNSVKAWYINVVEHGAVAHQITPKDPNGILALQGGAGMAFSHKVEHPGFAARKFFEGGTQNAEQIAAEQFQMAGIQIMAAMVVKS